MRTNILLTALVFTVVFILPTGLMGQQPAPQTPAATLTFPFEGEINGTNVYVRSGPGVNYYPCTKLNAGDRVVVQGEKFGWYQIVPPTRCYSYIDMSVVEKQASGKSGKVTQDKVYVRAGSDIEDRKTSTQLVLNKGDAVRILGEADGLYKIAPPTGAFLWVSKQFVENVPDRLKTGLLERHTAANKAPATPATPAPTPTGTPVPAGAPVKPAIAPNSAVPPTANAAPTTPTAGQPVIPPPVKTTPEAVAGADANEADADIVEESGEEPLDADSTLPGEPKPAVASKAKPSETKKPNAAARGDTPGTLTSGSTNRWAAMLTVLESELRSIVQNPADEQTLAALQARYTEIATQQDDNVVAQVAQIRIRQLGELLHYRAGKAEVETDAQNLESFRANMDQERMKIMSRRVAAAQEKYDLEGELRQSYAFAPEKRRYRLVDPANQTTIAYVDVPVALDVRPDELIGQRVGIRTSSMKFNPATQVPIAVATALVDLSPRAKVNPKPADDSTRGNKPSAPPAAAPKDTKTSPPDKGTVNTPPAGPARLPRAGG